MMIEHSILKAFVTNRSLYYQYKDYININDLRKTYPDIYKIYITVNEYYKVYNKDSITEEDLYTKYIILYNKDNSMRTVISNIYKEEINNELIKDYINKQKKLTVINKLLLACVDYTEGRTTLDSIKDLYSKLDIEETNNNTIFVETDVVSLLNKSVVETGLRWRLSFLNKSLGSLRKGTFGFIYARPETGKSTFLLSEISHLITQTDRPILWCNNEEDGSRVGIRCVQAVLGLTNKELLSNPEEYNRQYNEITKGNIKIYDDAMMTTQMIESICKELNPALIVLDQIDKIKGVSVTDRYDLTLKSLYQWARELSKKYGPVIGVCQAGSTGEGKKWLTMNDVDSSHTAKQGEADWMLGIGKTNEEGLADIRYLNINKNKLTGDADSLPELRHGKAEVIIQPEIARYREI